MIAVGVGCRSACTADHLVALVRETLAFLPPGLVAGGLYSIGARRDAPCLAIASQELGIALTLLELGRLREVARRAHTVSSRVEALFGVPSIAETAALAGAGTTAVLLVPRRASAMATCAIAGPEPIR